MSPVGKAESFLLARSDVVRLPKPAHIHVYRNAMNKQMRLHAECSGLSRPSTRATKPSSQLYSP